MATGPWLQRHVNRKAAQTPQALAPPSSRRTVLRAGGRHPAISQVSPQDGQEGSAANVADQLSSLATKWPPARTDRGLGFVMMYGLMEGLMMKLKLQYCGHLT